jgi:hypothetical protein
VAALVRRQAHVVTLHRHGVGCARAANAIQRSSQVLHPIGLRHCRIVGKHIEQGAPEDLPVDAGGLQIIIACTNNREIVVRL